MGQRETFAQSQLCFQNETIGTEEMRAVWTFFGQRRKLCLLQKMQKIFHCKRMRESKLQKSQGGKTTQGNQIPVGDASAAAAAGWSENETKTDSAIAETKDIAEAPMH